jgi:hypothetical protein
MASLGADKGLAMATVAMAARTMAVACMMKAVEVWWIVFVGIV